MISLGIICYQGHSSAAALVRDGEVLGAVAEERFSRKKFDDSFPAKSIEYLIKEFSLTFEEIDHIGIAWSPKTTLIGQLKNFSLTSMGFMMEKRAGSTQRSRLEKFFLIANLKKEIRKRYNYKGEINFVDHHLSHALSAYIQGEHSDSIVMVADGMGEHASTTIYEFESNQQKIIYRDNFPHSLGVFYSAATQFLGFIPDSDEFKVMGMAAYSSEKKHYDKIAKLYSFVDNHLVLNLNYFDIHKKANQFFSKKFSELFIDVKTPQDKMDFAHCLQLHFNQMVVQILKEQKKSYSSRNFCAAGGVFLNCLLNQELRQSGLFDSYTFFPVADDNGTAVGAAQMAGFKKLHPMKKMEHLYLGPDIGNIDESVLQGLNYKKIDHYREIAELLAKGQVVAWVQDRMEFGHRSLGNRSILGNPKDKSMKDVINQKIKLREPYRPFAPSLLEEKLEEFFIVNKRFSNVYPFMIETLTANENAKAQAPAIVHEDGTSRVQTVSMDSNPKFHQLINEFYTITGCPILLNTSFNTNGMPIVQTAEDAVDCFLKTDINYLVLKDYLVWK